MRTSPLIPPCTLNARAWPFRRAPHDLEPLDGRIGGLHRLETADRTDQLFQLAVISFDDVVEIFRLSMLGLGRTFAFVFQLSDRRAVGRRFVGVQNVRQLPVLQAFQRFPEKPLGRLGVPG